MNKDECLFSIYDCIALLFSMESIKCVLDWNPKLVFDKSEHFFCCFAADSTFVCYLDYSIEYYEYSVFA